MSEKNIVETALEAGRQQALKAQQSPLPNGKPYIVGKDSVGADCLLFLEAQFETPARRTGTVKIADTKSFKIIWNAFNAKDQSKVYGSMTPAQFIAVFNDNDADPDYRDHRAVYTMAHSPEWNEWTKSNGARFAGTTEFAEWMENHIPDMLEPAGARMLEIVLNLRVQANAVYSKVQRLSDGHCEFTYQNVVEGQSKDAAGQIRIPEQFAIEIPVFSGLDAKKHRVDARFRYRLQGSTLSIWFELVRPHKVVEEAFKEVLATIEKECSVAVIFGSPE